MKRHETNEEFMVRVMNFCPQGALSQAFIMEALMRYCEQCAEADIPDTPLLSGQAWKNTAAWLKEQLEAHLR